MPDCLLDHATVVSHTFHNEQVHCITYLSELLAWKGLSNDAKHLRKPILCTWSFFVYKSFFPISTAFSKLWKWTKCLASIWHFIQRHSPSGRWTSTGRSLSLLSDSQLTVLWIGNLSSLDMLPDSCLRTTAYIITRPISAKNIWCHRPQMRPA